MRRAAVAVALVLALAACSSVRDPFGPMAHMRYDLNDGPCSAEVWVTGVIVGDQSGLAAIQDDQGVVRSLVWGSHNTASVDWGHRYTIGGSWFNVETNLWACAGADAVIPR
jgi:hypothetical protein